MSAPADSVIPCLDCGTLIEEYHLCAIGVGISTVYRKSRCVECEYREHFRTSKLVKRKPFQDPFPRPTFDGRMPADLRAELATQYAKRTEGQP